MKAQRSTIPLHRNNKYEAYMRLKDIFISITWKSNGKEVGDILENGDVLDDDSILNLLSDAIESLERQKEKTREVIRNWNPSDEPMRS